MLYFRFPRGAGALAGFFTIRIAWERLSIDRRIRFVFFDVGGTILRVQPSVSHVYSRTAREHGWDVEPGWLSDRFEQACAESLRRSMRRSHRCSDEILKEEWFRIVRDTFGNSVPGARIRRLFEDLYQKFVSASAWTVAPGARATLEDLRQRGYQLGILSNWDSRLPTTLEQLDLASFFDVVVISYKVGYEKPHRRIFEIAVSKAGQPASRILHVGDSWVTDILPAQKVGMKTLWMAPSETRSPQEDAGPGIDGFRELTERQWEKLLGAEL